MLEKEDDIRPTRHIELFNGGPDISVEVIAVGPIAKHWGPRIGVYASSHIDQCVFI